MVRVFTAEVRGTKTQLASTVAELMKEKEIAETESKTQRALVVQLKDQLQATNNNLTQERAMVAEIKQELEVGESSQDVGSPGREEGRNVAEQYGFHCQGREASACCHVGVLICHGPCHDI